MYKMYNVIQPAAGGFFLRFWTSKTAIFKGETAKTGSKKIRILSENLIPPPCQIQIFGET